MLYRRYIIHGGAKCMIRFACFIVAWCWGSLRVFPGGNQVDGLPPAPSGALLGALPLGEGGGAKHSPPGDMGDQCDQNHQKL